MLILWCFWLKKWFLIPPSPPLSLPLFFCTVFKPLAARLDLRPGLVENKAFYWLPVTFLPDQLFVLTVDIATGLVSVAQGGGGNTGSEPPVLQETGSVSVVSPSTGEALGWTGRAGAVLPLFHCPHCCPHIHAALRVHPHEGTPAPVQIQAKEAVRLLSVPLWP